VPPNALRRIVLGLIVLACLAGLGWLVATRLAAPRPATLLYGNVEIRQVDLAFNSEGRVIAMAKREGDKVASGEVIATLDPDTYQNVLALAEAQRDAARAQFDELMNGTRPEDIDQARANYALAQAGQANADATFARQRDLAARAVSSQQQLDDARMALDTARARVAQTKAALDEAVAGPRAEDRAAAHAKLRAAEAQVALAQTQLARTKLTAPADGIVMTRVVEPGTVVLPTSAVYSMAITSEVWVRAFAPEPLLGRVAPGTAVEVFTDSRPDRPYRGVVGYVSPVAEFTPKTVETPELRTQLVYRLRIRIQNPDEAIRQGQPVTIRLPAAS
jgi:HlyD family secretion protein